MSASPRLLGATNGTDQRLDLLIAELRGLRADLAAERAARAAASVPSSVQPSKLQQHFSDNRKGRR